MPSRCRQPGRCSSASSRPGNGRRSRADPPVAAPDPIGCGYGQGPLLLTIVARVKRPDSEGTPEHTGVQIPHLEASPIRQVSQRLAFALFVLLLTIFLVYVDRDGYRD